MKVQIKKRSWIKRLRYVPKVLINTYRFVSPSMTRFEAVLHSVEQTIRLVVF